MAWRIATSRVRAVARASSRLARFPHAMSSTQPTVAISIHSSWLTFETIASPNGCATRPKVPLACGYRSRRRAIAASSSPRAVANVAFGLSRAAICRKYSVREARRFAGNCIGPQKSTCASGNVNPRGMTPTIVCGCPPSVIVSPMTSGRAPKTRRHNRR
jgi:hypothetical protein